MVYSKLVCVSCSSHRCSHWDQTNNKQFILNSPKPLFSLTTSSAKCYLPSYLSVLSLLPAYPPPPSSSSAFLPSKTYVESLLSLSKSDPPVSSKQGNTSTDPGMPQGGAVWVCGRATLQQTPSSLTVMSRPQQGDGAHTHS